MLIYDPPAPHEHTLPDPCAYRTGAIAFCEDCWHVFVRDLDPYSFSKRWRPLRRFRDRAARKLLDQSRALRVDDGRVRSYVPARLPIDPKGRQ